MWTFSILNAGITLWSFWNRVSAWYGHWRYLMKVDIQAHLTGEEVPGKAFWDGFTRLAAVHTGRD